MKIDSIILILTPFGDIFLYLICEIYLGQLKFGYVKNDVQVSVLKKKWCIQIRQISCNVNFDNWESVAYILGLSDNKFVILIFDLVKSQFECKMSEFGFEKNTGLHNLHVVEELCLFLPTIQYPNWFVPEFDSFRTVSILSTALCLLDYTSSAPKENNT